MRLSLIVARSRNNVIGDAGRIPWDRIPEDMANFRKLTMGKPVIMGRKTFESLGEPLPGRKNVVLGRSIIRGIEGAHVVRTPAEAIVEAFDAHGTDEAFVIGGAEIYGLFMNLCDDAYVTTIDRDMEGDTLFPFNFDASPRWASYATERIAPGVKFRRYTRTRKARA